MTSRCTRRPRVKCLSRPLVSAGVSRIENVAEPSKSWQNHIVSPTVLQSGPYRLFFFSSDRGEPLHVHVDRERRTAKFWLSPVRLEYNQGFAATELNKVETIVREHEAELVRAWHEYFKSGN